MEKTELYDLILGIFVFAGLLLGALIMLHQINKNE